MAEAKWQLASHRRAGCLFSLQIEPRYLLSSRFICHTTSPQKQRVLRSCCNIAITLRTHGTGREGGSSLLTTWNFIGLARSVPIVASFFALFAFPAAAP